MKSFSFHNIFHKVTFEMLRKNRTRTIVTIIGIILSTALITAITTFVSSLSNSMMEFKIAEQGNWHGAILAADDATKDEIKKSSDVTKTMELHNQGYAAIPEPKSQYTPYIGVFAADQDFFQEMSIQVTDGRLPQNSNEVIIPENMNRAYGQQYKINQKLELNLSYLVNQGDGTFTYVNQFKKKISDTIEEKYKKETKNNYTIVGYYTRLSYENDFDPISYNLLTVYDNQQSYYDTNVFYRMNDTNKVDTFNNSYSDRFLTSYHAQLLMLMGSSKYTSYNAFIYALAMIVIVLVAVGSIFLIYNSFAISVNERTRQYGLLSSIGATKKQLRQSILFESFFVSLFGIPIGIISGIMGIGITLMCIRGKLDRMAEGIVSVGKMQLHISWTAILVAIIVAMITVLISAFIPMIRVSRISALDAIRQNTDITLKKNKFKTSKLFYFVFGFEGMLARKNFKRSHKKYRTTVFSLIVSIVLFISASSVSGYMIRTIEGVYEVKQYQVTYSSRIEFDDPIIGEMRQVDQIKRMGLSREASGTANIKDDLVSKEYKMISGKDLSEMPVNLYVIDDASYLSYIKQLNLSKETFYNMSNPVLVCSARYRSQNKDTGKVTDTTLFSQNKFNMDVTFTDLKEYENKQDENKEYIEQLEKQISSDRSADNEKLYDELADIHNQMREQSKVNIGLQIGAVTDELPFCTAISQRNNSINLFCAESMLPQIQKETGIANEYTQVFFDTDNHTAVAESLRKIVKGHGLAESMVDDIASEYESQESMIYIVRVFSFGFIILMSLISTANVFNTISTNMILRRREFAMLRSVGLTKRGFSRMMYYECILYGSKSLIFGIPISLVFTWLIFKKVSDVMTTSYQVPYSAILIAIVSIFTIVLITMWYSKAKINQLNLIESIKNENV